MSRRKKVNKFKVAIVVFALLVFFMSVTGLGRFTYNAVRDRYLSSKKFYFTSDLLTPNGNASNPHVYENWDGIGIYELDINMFSKNNDLERYDGELLYSVKLDYNKNNILCSLYYNDFSRSTGNEYYTNNEGEDDRRQSIPVNNEGKLKIYIKLNEENSNIEVGDDFSLKVTAYTSEPYKKTIEGTFNIVMSDLAFYMVEDQSDVPYVLMNVRNTRNYDSNVTINFNSDLVRLDMNSNVYLDSISDTGTGSEITGVEAPGNVVNSITFTMPKESSENIKFYKKSHTNGILASDYSQWLNIFTIERTKK